MKPEKSHRLIVIRHATRDLRDRARDNGLNAEGRKEAKALRKLLKTLYARSPDAELLSSPKLRCLETLAPFAKVVGKEMVSDPRLEEQRTHESDAAFRRRVAAFWKWARTSSDLPLIVCSHGDWIPVLFELVFGSPLDLSKGGVAEISFKTGRQPDVKLKFLAQSGRVARLTGARKTRRERE